MALHIRDLVVALIRRMQSSEIAGLRSSLLLIFARLVGNTFLDFSLGNDTASELLGLQHN